MSSDTSTTSVSILEVPRRDRHVLVGGLVALGLVLGVVAGPVVRWAQGVDWLPFGKVIDAVAVLSGVGWWLPPVAGVVLGLVVAAILGEQLLRVELSDSEIVLVRGKKRTRFSRSQVAQARVEDKHLVLRDDRDADLVREKLDGPPADVDAALRRLGWPVPTP